MSATTKLRIVIAVTRGDCVEENRKSGRSNTGTYFICSSKNFEEFSEYFAVSNKYQFDLKKIDIYKTLFKNYFLRYRDEYNGKMSKFDAFINYLISLNSNPELEISLRRNDSRIFMRFSNNADPVVNAFRHVLYEDLSLISIEKIDDICYVYPIINEKFIRLQNDFSTGLVIDDD